MADDESGGRGDFYTQGGENFSLGSPHGVFFGFVGVVVAE
jgi:hypothetical protein